MHIKKPYSTLLALALGSINATPAFSATDETTSPIIVTATRTAQTADAALASVTVLTREEIESSGSNTVMELLQNHSVGIDVSRNGGPGGATSLYLRGSESDHVLVLVDGIRVASVTSGGFNWNSLPPEQIERIEIVRGPNSTLYGSEAIGGVIQIFTRKGKATHASVTVGSFRTAKTTVGSGGSVGNSRFHLNLSHEQADSFSSKSSSSSEEDADGYTLSSITAGFTAPLGSRSELGLNLFHSAGQNDYDDSSYHHAYSNNSNSGGELHLDWQTTANWSQRFSVNSSQDKVEANDSSPGTLSSWRRGAEWQNDIMVGEQGLLTVGAEAQQDSGKFSEKYAEEISNRAGYLQYQWSGNQYDLLIGGRRDNHSAYGVHDTGRLTLGSILGDGRAYASYATAFKAPTFNELYYPNYGDPDIKPEESTSMELGYRLGGLQASLYQTRVKNLIQSYPVANVGHAKMQGLELEYRYHLGDWQLKHGLTVQRARDEDTDKKLLRRADKKMLFSATGPINARTRLGVELNYTGPRMDYSDVELRSYTLLNLTAEYRLAPRWLMKGRIENLLDEDYQLVDGYNTPGLSAYLTLAYRP